ncbi:MAG: hypothetical protein KJ053_10585 [Dehalococcoidia bacterium]|nr:hypothetical protein [Dehalococcoidia bacterium]
MIRLAGLALALVVAASLLVGWRCFLQDGGEPGPSTTFGPPTTPVIILSAPDAGDWLLLQRATGAAFRVGKLDELLARPTGIVPAGATLTSADHQMIHRWVDSGGRLVSAHRDLLAGLGVERAGVVTVGGVTFGPASERATWPVPADVAGLRKGRILKSWAPLLTEQGAVLAAEAVLGKGSILAFAFDPVADSLAGYELIPDLGRTVAAWTGAPPGPQREAAEVYVDPGSLSPELKKDPDAVAASLDGVRAAHIAAWHFGFRDPANDYDYTGLIKALHARGIAAYAWLEPPYVNLLLWEDHPECREKTATGRDAQVDWRALIALEDERCFALAWEQWTTVLTAHDWDGVNVAELYFEPAIHRENFTPFHPSALKRFAGNPDAAPEQFLDFRIDLAIELNSRMLAGVRALPGGADFDLQMTIIDDTIDPVHARAVGSDVSRLAVVARDHGASLQLEDPYTTWASSPLRYEKISSRLASLLPAGQAFIDINIVPREAGLPTAAATAGEFELAVAAASRASGRVAVFSVSTVAASDRGQLAGAMAATADTLDTGLRSSFAVVARSPGGAADGLLKVDGSQWPAAAGRAIIPGGEHRLEWAPGAPVGPALLRFTAELGSASVEASALQAEYFSRSRAYLVVDRAPQHVTVDGVETAVAVISNPDGGYTLRLPSGLHTVRIETAP